MKRMELFVLMLVLFAACGHENPAGRQDVARPEIRIFFAPSAPHQDVNNVTVTVSAPDMDEITETLIVEGKTASGALEVPVGSGRAFTVEAYEGNVLRYRGSKTRDIPTGDPIFLEFYLEPTTLAITIKSLSQAVPVGNRFTAEVKVNNVDQLYAITFVLQYNTDLLRIQEAEPGDFLGDDALFFRKIDDLVSTSSRRNKGTISIGVTLKGVRNGVDGSGIVATISFEALTEGTAKIELLQDRRLSLSNPDGDSVTGFDDIIVIDESITITGT